MNSPSNTLLHIADQMVVALGYDPLIWNIPAKPSSQFSRAVRAELTEQGYSHTHHYNTTVWLLGKHLHNADPVGFTLRDWNKMVSEYHITDFGDKTPNKEAKTLSNKFFAHHTDKVVIVHRRDVLANRPRGRCYLNSYEEMLSSKNSQAFVLIDIKGGSNDAVKVLCPHSINYDPTSKTYYDTTQIWAEGQTSYPAFLINDAVKSYYKRHPLEVILNGGKTIDQTYGSFITLYWNGVSYGFHATDHNGASKDGDEGHFRRYEFVEALTA